MLQGSHILLYFKLSNNSIITKPTRSHMKKSITTLSLCIICLTVHQSFAQSNKSADLKFWEWIVTPYNTISDQSYNLTIDMIHADAQNKANLVNGIEQLNQMTVATLKMYESLPSDMLPEYEKLRTSAAISIKTMRVVLDLDNLTSKVQSIPVLSSREILERMRQSAELSKRLDSLDGSFQNTLATFAKARNIKLLSGDTATANEKKRVGDVLNFSTALYKMYLETMMPFEDFTKLLSLEDSSIALIKTREALRTAITEKKKQYKSLEISKPKDALLLEMDTFLNSMIDFSGTPIDAIIIYLKTPKDDRTIKMGRDYNLAINAYNTELVPAINNFSVKMQEYKQKNIPPRKTKYKVVSSED